MSPAPIRTRLGAAAGALGAAAAFTMIVGAGPAPSVFQLIGSTEDVSGNCDEAEHADDPGCAGIATPDGTGDGSTTTTTDDGSTTTQAPPDPTTEVRAIDAAGAGTVLVAVEGGGLRLVAATPTSGWQVEVEQATGLEVEVDFRSGTRRVQVDVEIEDGQVRERVRVRDDADGTDIRTEDGVVVRDDSADDNSGPSNDDDTSADDDSSNRGPGSDDDTSIDDHGGDDSIDDNSGSGDDSIDDHDSDDSVDDNSGHGSDDD
jgi:hypothetical protein